MPARKRIWLVMDERGEQLGLDYVRLEHAMIAVDDLQTEAHRAERPAPRLTIMLLDGVKSRPATQEELRRKRPLVRLARAIRDLPDMEPDDSWHEVVLEACRGASGSASRANGLALVAEGLGKPKAKPPALRRRKRRK